MWNYAEDIIEFIAGYRTANGKLVNSWNRLGVPINLARYDVSILESLANQTVEHGRPYTFKQSQLAVKVIVKYRRQLSKLISVVDDENKLQFRLGIRVVDQSKTIKIVDSKIQVKFPYNTDYIKSIKTLAANGYGSVEFNHNEKIWILGMTEYMVNYVVAFGNAQQFEIDPELVQLATRIIDIESSPYKIELTETEQGLCITNAHENLINYIDQNIGGITINNLYTLVDYSTILGYTVNQKLIDKLATHCSELEMKLLLNRKIELSNETNVLDNIFEYAAKAKRLPVHFYDTNVHTKKDTDTVIYYNNKKDPTNYKQVKLIISMSTVLVGLKKQDWIRRAEKVIFIK